MNLFIDAEWNDYKGDLISLALVDENGREFYEVLGCENPSSWVAENVMPKLGKPPIPSGYSPYGYSKIQALLSSFLCGYHQIHIISDWPEDIQHFCDLLIIGPGERISTPPITMEIRRDLDSVASENPHNALADAHAIRLSWMQLQNK